MWIGQPLGALPPPPKGAQTLPAGGWLTSPRGQSAGSLERLSLPSPAGVALGAPSPAGEAPGWRPW